MFLILRTFVDPATQVVTRPLIFPWGKEICNLEFKGSACLLKDQDTEPMIPDITEGGGEREAGDSRQPEEEFP